MSSISPTTVGFRVVFRRPAIPLAEIAWRWSFGAAVWFLAVMYLFEYADSLPVNTLDRLLLATNQPILMAHAIRRILEGCAFRFTEAGILLAIALTLAWTVLASVGRTATIKALMDEFGIVPPVSSERKTFSWLMTLNFLRAAVTLAAIVSACGLMMLTSSVWASTRLSVADATRFWFALLFLAWAAWTILNWFLSTATVFVVVKQESSLTAVLSTMKFCQSQTGGVLTSGTWFELAHLGIFLGAVGTGFTVLTAIGSLHLGPVLFLEFGIAVLYFAAVDFFYSARLATYVAMIGGAQLAGGRHSGNFPSAPPVPVAIDQSELILSDVPLPAN
jgi:hypothetical protein